jgi:zinc transport system substrate-binding protein
MVRGLKKSARETKLNRGFFFGRFLVSGDMGMLGKILLGGLLCLPCWLPATALAAVECFVSIPPQAFLLESIGGQEVRARVMVPPGASPHTFEPSPKQVASLSQARVYFAVGLPFERRLLPRIKTGQGGPRVVDTSNGVALRSFTEDEAEADEAGHGHGHEKDHASAEVMPDPHFWLSPRLAKIMAANMAEALGSLEPGRTAEFQANLERLNLRLDEADRHLARALAPFKGKEFLVYHPAFGYLGDAYGLKQVTVEVEGKEPGPKSLARIIDLAKARGIKVVFVQPQFPLAGARQVALAIGGVVVPMDPLARDYLANLERMAQELEKALR